MDSNQLTNMVIGAVISHIVKFVLSWSGKKLKTMSENRTVKTMLRRILNKYFSEIIGDIIVVLYIGFFLYSVLKSVIPVTHLSTFLIVLLTFGFIFWVAQLYKHLLPYIQAFKNEGIC